MPSAGPSPAIPGSGTASDTARGGGPSGPEVNHHSGASATPLGLTAALVAVCAWGLGNTIIAAVPMTGMAIAFYRLGFASVLYTVILYARGGRLTSRSFRFGWEGGIAFGADIAAFFVAIHLTSVANATTISALQPLVIIVIPITLLTQDLFRTENQLSWTNALAILAIVLVPGSGHILMNWAHAHTTLVLTSLITLAMPVISALSAAVFLGQSVSTVQVLGIALVLIALAFVIVLDAKTTADATEPAA